MNKHLLQVIPDHKVARIMPQVDRLEHAAYVLARGKRHVTTLLQIAAEYDLAEELVQEHVIAQIIERTFSKM